MIAYRLTCIPTGKIYIGITRRSLDIRVAAHFNAAASKPWPESRWLFCAMRRYPRPLWTVEVIGRADSWDALLRLERELIAQFRSNDPIDGYNRTAGGQGTVGLKRTIPAEQRAKVGAFHRGRKRPAATREKLKQLALRRWRENPSQFPEQVGDIRRDAAIARRYWSAKSYAEAGRDFGIGGPAAHQAVGRFLKVFSEWLACVSPMNEGLALPKRIDPEWIEAVELSL